MLSKWWTIEYSKNPYEEEWNKPEIRSILPLSAFHLEEKFKQAKEYAIEMGYHGARLFLYERLDTGAFNTIDVYTYLNLKTRPRVLNNPSKKITSDLDNDF